MADLLSPLEPLTLAEVRLNLRQPPEQQNARLQTLITVAREFVEAETEMVLTTLRSVTETARSLGRWIDLSSWPVSQVVEIRCPYGGLMAPISSTAWQASYVRRPVRILPVANKWGVPGDCSPSAGLPIEIDIIAGYTDPTAIPMRAKHAMQMLIAHWFANPDAVLTGQRAAAVEVPLGVIELLRGLRLLRV